MVAEHAESRWRLGSILTATTTGRFICNIPFADHNAMIDPSDVGCYCASSSNAWGDFGWPAEHLQCAAREFLLKDQCKDGRGSAVGA